VSWGAQGPGERRGRGHQGMWVCCTDAAHVNPVPQQRLHTRCCICGQCHLWRCHASGLSGGQKARTALARAAYARAAVTLLDDPLCALDPGLAAQVSSIAVSFIELGSCVPGDGWARHLGSLARLQPHLLPPILVQVFDACLGPSGILLGAGRSVLLVTSNPLFLQRCDVVAVVQVSGVPGVGRLIVCAGSRGPCTQACSCTGAAVPCQAVAITGWLALLTHSPNSAAAGLLPSLAASLHHRPGRLLRVGGNWPAALSQEHRWCTCQQRRCNQGAEREADGSGQRLCGCSRQHCQSIQGCWRRQGPPA
jgi:hypothetical protein